MKPNTLAEQLFYTTVRIESTTSTGACSVGTGFIFEAKKGSKTHLVLVTNKHVVKDAAAGSIRFHLRGDDGPKVGYKLNIESFEKLWLPHKEADVDVTVMSMSLILEQAKKSGQQLFFKSVPSELCPSEEQLKGLDAIEEILFVGYPNGIYDGANYLPVARRGITASPIRVDHEGRPRFLIDAAVFGGSSGSPVFLFNRGIHPDREGNAVLGTRIHLLGILAAGYYKQDDFRVVERPLPTVKTELVAEGAQMINLGVVYKAQTINEAASQFLG